MLFKWKEVLILGQLLRGDVYLNGVKKSSSVKKSTNILNAEFGVPWLEYNTDVT